MWAIPQSTGHSEVTHQGVMARALALRNRAGENSFRDLVRGKANEKQRRWGNSSLNLPKKAVEILVGSQ